MKRRDIVSVIRDPKWKKLRVLFTNEVLKDVTKIISSDEVQNVCDEVGISTKGYNALYQLLKDTLRTHGITKSIFPAPKTLRFAKRTCNDELKHKIGEFMCVNDTLTIAAWGKNRGKDGNIAFVYNEFNNIFVDLQRLQRAMILFYGLPHQCK